MAWEAYEPTLPFLLGLSRDATPPISDEAALTECINRGNANNGRRDIQPRLLVAFGVNPESLSPRNDPISRHLVAGVMCAVSETRGCVWRRVRQVKRHGRWPAVGNLKEWEKMAMMEEEEEDEMREEEEEEALGLNGDFEYFNNNGGTRSNCITAATHTWSHHYC
uniref:Uncharacterized protein n=1 Tax=Leersia perrieri TaxID=77586 RepID=A0A0D9WRX2_9ORYZ